MIVALKSILWCLLRRLLFRVPLDAELLALRHQVAVLQHRAGKPPKLSRWDRLLFALSYRANPFVLRSILIVKPDTVVRCHRAGFRLFWRFKSRSVLGRPKIAADIRMQIREMSMANPLWGAPRIHGELLKLGINISQTTVAKHMIKRSSPTSQNWRTFLRNHGEDIAAVDLFVVPTLGFKLMFGLVILDHRRRWIIHTNATYHPTAEWIARQIVEAFPWETAPTYLLRDRDASYGIIYRKKLSVMGIRDRPVAPHSPWQNGYVERVIGSIRREMLDHVIVLNDAHLQRLLRRYADYYNDYRTHLGLTNDTPLHRAVQRTGQIVQKPQLGGLYHAYVWI